MNSPIHPLKRRSIMTALAAALCMAPAVAQADSADPSADTPKAIPGISMSTDLFTQFCIDQRADISTLIDLLPENGYVWMPKTKRFMHPTHDVSFALLQSELGFACSMQFANHVDPATSAAIFVKKTSSRQVTVNVGFPDEASDRNYVQASVAAEANLTQ